ncbi:hypothetical protein [Luteitalea sp.]
MTPVLLQLLLPLLCLTLHVCIADSVVLVGEGGLAAASTALSGVLRRPRGRPKKFDEPTRVVSMTLPESAIDRLSQTDRDLGRAVVRMIDRKLSTRAAPAAKLVVFGNHAVISVIPTPTLERRVGVQLVPLPDGRALLSFETPKTIADLELSITDALDDPTLSRDDRVVFDAIRSILREARQASDVALLRRNIIVLEGARRPRRSRKPAPATA